MLFPICRIIGAPALVLALSLVSLHSEVATFNPVADTTLIQVEPNANLGGANFFNAGTAGNALNWFTGANSASAMFGVSNGYLKRNTDYRSVLGEIIRKHLGATQTQLNQIIPGYADPSQRLLAGGTVADSSTVSTAIRGEVGFL